jgi:formylglycine-generating enzyme required for sulfatase activity
MHRTLCLPPAAVGALALLMTMGVRAAAPPQTYSNDLGMKFALIPAGSFNMGRAALFEDGLENELPAHRVRIRRPFYLQTTKVTQEQWLTVVGGNPSKLKRRSDPMVNVSWDDIQAFIQRLNAREGCGSCYRLPTEAEWEYAYRAAASSAYYWGNSDYDLGEYAWFGQDASDSAKLRVRLWPNAWGLFSLDRGRSEWVADCYHENYRGAPSDGSEWAESCYRGSDGAIQHVARGETGADRSDRRAAKRDHYPRNHRDQQHGFRLVRIVAADTQ